MKQPHQSSLRLRVGIMFAATSMAAASAVLAQQGGLQGQMDKMFGQMSTSAPPQVVMDARRGVISGGSLEVRAPVAPPLSNAINFQPPSVTAGCSGISIYGGSLSFISGDQIVQEFRSIASNAEGLAFQMALQAMSNQLSKEEEWFSKIQTDLSQHLQSSCAIANEALTQTGAASAINTFGTQVGQNIATQSGDSSDTAAAANSNTPSNNLANSEGQKHPDVLNNILYGNVVWQALQSSKTGVTFGGGNQLQEEIMSITGTIIVCNPKADTSCASTPGADGIGMTFVQPTLKLEDLVYGSTSDNQSLLTCSDSRCMNPGQSNWTNPGFLSMVNANLGTDGTNGIIGAVLTGSDPTTAQMNFLANTGAAGGLLMRIGRFNPMAMQGYAQEIAAPLALEMSRKLVDQMIDTAAVGLAGSQNPAAAHMVQQLRSRRQEIDQEYNALRQDKQFDVDAYNLYQVYAANAPSMIHPDPASHSSSN